jgi:hypothetical protein
MAADLHLTELAKKLYPYLEPDFLNLRSGYDLASYTPTYVGGTTAGATTYTTQSGHYVRFGPLVVVQCIVIWTAATGTGEARISLPFTSATSNGNAYPSLWYQNVTFGALPPIAVVNANNDYARLYTPANNAGSTVINVEAAGDIRFTVAYRIA